MHNGVSSVLFDVIAANVARLRNKRGLTQAQLADLVGVHRNTIVFLEQKKFKGLRTTTLEDLAKALGVEVRDLLLPAEETLPADVEASLDAFLDSENGQDASTEEREALRRAAMGARWGPLTNKGWLFVLEAVRTQAPRKGGE